MKKILALAFLFSIKIAAIRAQTPEPTFINNNKGLKKEEILKLEMKDDLKIYDKRFDSILVIQKEFQAKLKLVQQDKKLIEKRQKELNDLKRRRLRSAGLIDSEIKRVEDYFLVKEKQPQR